MWVASLRRIRRLEPKRILLAGFALFVLYGFPGYMSTDSFTQLMQARAGTFSDGHPPIMAAQWWLLDRIVAGPVLMFFLQGALFLGGLYALLRRFIAPRAAAWTTAALLLFPPILTPMAVIWKDSQMAAYLLAGTAALLDDRRRIRMAGLALLVAAAAVRHNGFAAVVPIVVLLFRWRPGGRRWKRIAAIAGVTCAVVALGFTVTRVLATKHVRLTPVPSDIVEVLACTGDRSDADLREVLRDTPLAITEGIQQRAKLLHGYGDTYRITSGNLRLFDGARTEAQREAMDRAWRELVFGDPLAYLRCHADNFKTFLGMQGVPLRTPVWTRFVDGADQGVILQHDASWSSAQAELGAAFEWLAENTPLYRQYVYAELAILVLLLFCRDRVTLALLSSGLLYELSFLPVGAEPDYRYSHWMITSTCVAVILIFVQRYRRRTR